ncbi:uncharacterized protein LOC123527731 [Mercenaria mercenaria]|uniref:uncharacterized protein LOC123527731 n=1 Tax=Mercenaria mercenaria TaxID=6596 RepID=UPI00234F3174|nr:uncharacterized protein LOC123527731 [Mercenaria mercenaria]
MRQEEKYILICLTWLHAVVFEVSTVAAITIDSVGSLGDIKTVQCDSKVTFICSIPRYYSMTWSIDSDIQAEYITTVKFDQYPPFRIDNIEFSSDTTRGVFNMTINPVTFKANGHEIKCEDGSNAVQVQLEVKVLPKQDSVTISESKDDSQKMITITAVSGCVFPSSAITMQWYYYEAGQTPELYKMGSPTDAEDSTVCTPETCGGDGVLQMSSTLSIPEVQTGKEYYFQIAIKHEDAEDSVIVDSTETYRIELTRPAGEKEESKPNVGLIVGLCVGLLVPILLLVGAYWLFKYCRNSA